MNCDLFEAIVDDLASDRYLEARAWEHALEHAKVCPACGERLAGMRLIAALLREQAAALQPKQAPPEVERALRIRFRQHRNLAGWRRRKQHWTMAAVAAAILIVLTGGILWKLNRTREAGGGIAPAPAVESHSSNSLSARSHNISTALQSPFAAEREAGQQNGEEGREFVPLPYAEGAAPLTGARVVTVRIPVSALDEIGFPVPVQASGQYVNADILIGEDGIARAIRVER